MAAADTARLIAQLELDDRKFNDRRVIAKVDRIDRKLGAFSGAVNRNLARGIDTLVSRGARALTGSIQTGLEELATLEDATRSVDAAIAQTGKTGQVTSGQIAQWANEIERNVGAAFDDKAIVAASTTLLRFGNVTADNLRPALEVMTDLATKTGGVDSAASLLAKSLADPTKAAGKLSRQGIILTKAEQDQIKAFVKAGKVGKAQALVLAAVERRTKGAAEASQGPYRKALSLMADAGEDARRALAEGFMPVIERVASKVSELAGDRKFITGLRNFGTALAGAFDKAVDFAESIDWDAVGAGLKSAADWGRRLFDTFANLPTEAKGVLLALVGLNKLSGGGVIKVGVDLFKDSAAGIFGHFFDRGSSPANPMFVSGGGIGPGGGEQGPAGGIAGLVKFGLIAAIPIAVATAGAQITRQIGEGIAGWVANGNENLRGFLSTGFAGISTALNPIGTFLDNLNSNLDSLSHLDQIPVELGKIPGILSALVNGKPLPGDGGGNHVTRNLRPLTGGNGVTRDLGREIKPPIDRVKAAVDDSKAGILESQGSIDASIRDRGDAVVNKTDETKRAVASAVDTGASRTSNATTGAGSRITSQSIGNTSRIVGAIGAIPAPIVNVHNDVLVSATNITRVQTQVSRQSTSSSRSDDNFNDHR